MKKRIPMAILAIIILTALDQLVKHLISTNFQVGQTRKIIDGVFQLNYVQNRGAAWGSFSGKIVFLLAITFVILLAAIYVYIRKRNIHRSGYHWYFSYRELSAI